MANSDFIGFVDSDDILDRDMYELLIANAFKYKADISMCGVRRVFPKKEELYGGKNLIKIYKKDDGITALFNGEILLSTYDKIFRAASVKNLKFEPALFEDTFYNFQAFKNSNISVFDDAIKYNYMIRDSSHSMSAFSWKYMNTLILTNRMIEVCEKELPDHIEEAKAFDFNQNIIVLNMIMHASRKKYASEFRHVAKNLEKYSRFYISSKQVTKRYKYGYSLFKLSPSIYNAVLNLYGIMTNSEHLLRKKDERNKKTVIK